MFTRGKIKHGNDAVSGLDGEVLRKKGKNGILERSNIYF
jgi:hypothetical protein